eukprot:CAMPEP_0117754968 /NCGR_PEP_ID=MMETSP0947-20121206/13164_1 /TAXON_ID=44440 /ORGANISM="Chattonella subsalsa, Strain CCMP2191" /LENGTH=339 /DNA_ID=CAMNT_0005574197 /DNA_START=139 /DNA_END=1158 /DNA_ORIENTATION=-
MVQMKFYFLQSLLFISSSQLSSGFLAGIPISQKYTKNNNHALLQLRMKSDLVESIEREISSVTGENCNLEFGYAGAGGGGGASVGTIKDSISGKQYFYKSTNLFGYEMLRAEFEGIKAMHETNTIKVPEPICKGTSQNNAFVVFEHLNMGGGGSLKQMGQELAAMHRNTSPNGKFGFHIDNTCGATPQPNTWEETWADFYCIYRLDHMIRLCERDGASFPNKKELRDKVHAILSEHNPVPSLVHGDLWSGNKGFADGKPVIFDPATYYGDREVDIAMSYLFGSFGSDFYSAYEEAWPISPGFEQRKTIYNLYHILNHFVLFGGGYIGQAQSMISRIMKY